MTEVLTAVDAHDTRQTRRKLTHFLTASLKI